MDILLIRHARAGERAAFAATGQDDALRPLTDEGRRRMRKATAGLQRVMPTVGRIGSSPFRRAVETAAVVGDAYGTAVAEVAALAPGGDPERVLAWLADQGDGCTALVGHEPDLGELGAYLLCGAPGGFMPLKKGAVCCIGFDGAPQAGTGELRWLLTSAQLRLLGTAG